MRNSALAVVKPVCDVWMPGWVYEGADVWVCECVRIRVYFDGHERLSKLYELMMWLTALSGWMCLQCARVQVHNCIYKHV